MEFTFKNLDSTLSLKPTGADIGSKNGKTFHIANTSCGFAQLVDEETKEVTPSKSPQNIQR